MSSTAAPPIAPEPSRQTYINIHSFQVLNAMSYTIALGSPLTLFTRELGASATIIGLIAAFTPALALLQVAVAPYSARVGYRPVVIRGWGGRVVSLILLVAMPFVAPLVSHEVAIAGVVLSMFIFNLLRGFAAGSWLPWTTSLVPRQSRARFLSRDRTLVAIASVLALGVSGAILTGEHTPLGYSAMFGLSFIAGAGSLYFVSRIPATPEPAGAERAGRMAQWRAVLVDRPYMAYALFGIGAQFTTAAANTFVIVFARDNSGLQDGTLILISAAAQLLGALALWRARRGLEALGSKRYLNGTLVWWLLYFGLWLAMALGAAPLLVVTPLLIAMNGAGGALFDLAHTRMLMNLGGDRLGSAHYFAVYQTGANIATSLSPIVWGAALDRMGMAGINRYGVFFFVEMGLLLALLLLLSRVRER
ncbi:MAG: MFS transporter [Thermoflexales bacterium]|nr:MFS transporter [Thermoflexales bacterium]